MSSLIKAGFGVEEIRSKWLSTFPDVLDDVIADFLKDKHDVYVLTDPKAIIAAGLQKEGYRWYAGPGPHSVRWNGIYNKMQSYNLSDQDLRSIDDSSTRVVSLLPAPGGDKFAGRGIVLGYVQSGKTTNFIATIAKAADEGYRLIIVLSGVTNPLRNQTQERLQKVFTGEGQQSWHWLTDLERDFEMSANASNLLGNPD